MAQLDGKQLKNQSISLDKLKGNSGLVTFTVSSTMSFATGSSLTQAIGNINSDLDVVNKKYVDDAVSVINGDFITGVTAGNGLSGGGTSGFITLDVNLGVDSGLTFSGNNLVVDLNIAGNGLDFTNGVLSVTTSQITSALAGNGLTANGGNLDVNVNVDSLEIVGDVIRLKDTVTGDRTFQNNFTIGGDLFVQGSFSVSGSASTINTVSLVVSDPIIALGHSQSGSPVLDEGLMFVRGTGLTQAFIWDESDDTFALVGTNDDHTVIGDVNIVSYSNLRIGGLTTSNIKITDGAQQDYVLVSDSSGFASWTSSILNAGTGLTKSGTVVSLDYVIITGTGLTQNGTQISIDTTSIAGDGLSAVGDNLYVNVGNGLSIQSDTVYLGGTLSQNTTIEAAGNDITINNVNNFSLTASTDIDLRIPGTFDHILNITPTDVQLYSGDVSTFSFVQTTENQVWLNAEQSGLASGIRITNTPSSLGGLDNSGGNYMLVKDQQANKGLVYEGDYTANFTTYSLVTKGYVDSAVANVGAGNGLQELSPGVVGLGGTLSQNTNIEVLSNTFTIESNSINQFYFDSSQITLGKSDGFGTSSNINFIDGQTNWSFVVSGSESSIYLSQGISSTDGTINKMLVKDTLSNKGLVYADDYTSNFSTHSLVTKGYVDSAVANVGAGNGLQELSPGVVGLGGTLSQNTLISGSSYDLTIQDFDTLTLTGSVVDVQLDNGLYLVDVGDGGSIDLYGGDVTIFATGSVDIISTNEFSVNTGTGSITTSNLQGLVYTTDYSATFVNNSLITKKYVDDAVSVINGDFITGVTAGSGLSGGGTSGFITLDVNVNADSLEIVGDVVRLKDTITGDRTFQDSLTVGGNLIVNGTVSYIYTENVYIEDNILTLNATWSGTPILNAGLEVIRGSETAAALIWNESTNLWSAGLSGSEVSILLNSGTGLTKNGATVSLDYVTITGVGLTQNGTQISVDTSGFATTLAGEGLSATGGTLSVNTSNGLTIISDSVQISDTAAGSGLTFSSGVFSVNVSNGIIINGDNVEVSPTIAGTGLTFSAGVLSVVAGSAIPVYQEFQAVTTSGNDVSVTGVTLSSTPNDYSRVEVYVNGQKQRLGDFDNTKDCYFGTAPATPIAINNLVAGDQFYWNGVVAGFDLSTTDVIEIVYES